MFILMRHCRSCLLPEGSNFKVNCHRLKHYYGGGYTTIGYPDLQTFLRTTKFRGRAELRLSDKNKPLRGSSPHAYLFYLLSIFYYPMCCVERGLYSFKFLDVCCLFVVIFAGFTQQFLKPLVFGVVSRSTRASHPLCEISLGRSDILSSYQFTFIFAYLINGLDLRRYPTLNIEDNVSF
ncbi:hypothetical protein Tco_1303842 [Tanacetum coccineum]